MEWIKQGTGIPSIIPTSCVYNLFIVVLEYVQFGFIMVIRTVLRILYKTLRT